MTSFTLSQVFKTENNVNYAEFEKIEPLLLSSSDNLNSYLHTGKYTANHSNTIIALNYPVNSKGIFYSYKVDSSTTIQKYIDVSGNIYTRYYSSSVWSMWNKTLTENQIGVEVAELVGGLVPNTQLPELTQIRNSLGQLPVKPITTTIDTLDNLYSINDCGFYLLATIHVNGTETTGSCVITALATNQVNQMLYLSNGEIYTRIVSDLDIGTWIYLLDELDLGETIATLDASKKIPLAQLPDSLVSKDYVDQSILDAINALKGGTLDANLDTILEITTALVALSLEIPKKLDKSESAILVDVDNLVTTKYVTPNLLFNINANKTSIASGFMGAATDEYYVINTNIPESKSFKCDFVIYGSGLFNTSNHNNVVINLSVDKSAVFTSSGTILSKEDIADSVYFDVVAGKVVIYFKGGSNSNFSIDTNSLLSSGFNLLKEDLQAWTVSTLTTLPITSTQSSLVQVNKTSLDFATDADILAGTALKIVDAEKLKTSLDTKIDVSKLGVADGVATLNSAGKIPASQIPTVSVGNTHVVADLTEMLALTANVGDLAIRQDNNTTYILRELPTSIEANWAQLMTPTSTVTSVNAQTGAVVLDAADVGAIDLSQKGAASGVATLDATSKIPIAQIPDSIPTDIATNAQDIVDIIDTIDNLIIVNTVNGLTGTVVLDADAVGAIPTTQKGVADGVASLDSSAKLSVDVIPTTVLTDISDNAQDILDLQNSLLNSLDTSDIGTAQEIIDKTAQKLVDGANLSAWYDSVFEGSLFSTAIELDDVINLNTLIEPKLYIQKSSANISTLRNYPIGAREGFLEVFPIESADGNTYIKQVYTNIRDYKRYHRVSYANMTNWFGWEDDFIPSGVVTEVDLLADIPIKSSDLGTTNLTNFDDAGFYHQSNAANATISNGYPQGGIVGALQVLRRGTPSNNILQIFYGVDLSVHIRDVGSNSAWRRLLDTQSQIPANNIQNLTTTAALTGFSYKNPIRLVDRDLDVFINTSEMGIGIQNNPAYATLDKNYPVAEVGFLDIAVVQVLSVDYVKHTYTSMVSGNVYTRLYNKTSGVFTTWTQELDANSINAQLTAIEIKNTEQHVALNKINNFNTYIMVSSATLTLEANKSYAVDISDNVNKVLTIPDLAFQNGDSLNVSIVGGTDTSTTEVDITLVNESWFNQPTTTKSLKLFRGQTVFIQRINDKFVTLQATGETQSISNVGNQANAFASDAAYMNVMPSRAFNTDYVNDTGNLICVYVTCRNNTGACEVEILVDGLPIIRSYTTYNNYKTMSAVALVPAGSTYSVTGNSMHYWVEFRSASAPTTYGAVESQFYYTVDNKVFNSFNRKLSDEEVLEARYTKSHLSYEEFLKETKTLEEIETL